MWYLAEVLLAEPKRRDRRIYLCESCNVLFQAAVAKEAYRKAVSWGRAYESESSSGVRFLGVAHLSTIGEELGDGVDICGRFFQKRDVWARKPELIPAQSQLAAIRWERNRDTPVGELLSPRQVQLIRRNNPRRQSTHSS
jgi:hypothetical protein